MSLVLHYWKSERCRIEDGIYLPDDSYFELNGFNVQSPRKQVNGLVSLDAEGWTALTPTGDLNLGSGLAVCFGETSWEGSGFIALLDDSDRSLRWLLHSTQSEPFVSAKISDGEILAKSADFITEWSWTIPVELPWKLRVKRVEA
jgi:hypothetical protein